jgi:hypothetical protein
MRRGRFDPRSTPEGLPISKDVWMLGAGLALLVDGATADDQCRRHHHGEQHREQQGDHEGPRQHVVAPAHAH